MSLYTYILHLIESPGTKWQTSQSEIAHKYRWQWLCVGTHDFLFFMQRNLNAFQAHFHDRYLDFET